MLTDFWTWLNDLSAFLTGALTIVLVLVVATIVQRIFTRLVRRAYWKRVDDRSANIEDVGELNRIKRQKTLVTLLESFVRYTVYGVALVIVVITVQPTAASSFLSAGILAVALGFGFQRLLTDVVAGALLLFEGQFAVGDVITVHQQNVTGVVEDFTLRTTKLRTFGGDAITILNGNMVAITRWSYGQRPFRVELLVRDEGAAVAVRAAVAREAALPDGLWVVPPALEATGDDTGATSVVRVRAVVAPEQEVLVERLGSILAAEAGDALVGDVLVLPVYEPVFDTWRSGVLLRS